MIDSNGNLPPRRFARRLRTFLTCLVLAGALVAPKATGAQEARFGDSTWVAPQAEAIANAPPIDAPGPRVAPRDSERTWETVLRAPFRLVFLPFRLLARGLEFAAATYGGRFVEPEEKPATYGPKLGVRIEVSDVTTGLQDVGVGPAVSWAPKPDLHLRASAVTSFKDRRHARLRGIYRDERPISFLLDGDYEYKPYRSYFGIGNDTEEEDRAFYRMEETRLIGTARIGLHPNRRMRLLAGYSGMSPGPGFHRGPPLGEVYPPGTVPFGNTATQYVMAGVGGDVATLDDQVSPSKGVHARGEIRHYLGLRDVDPDYNQWLLEGRSYLSVFSSRRVLVFRAAWTGVQPTEEDREFPFYRLASSEKSVRFPGFSTQRFRDRQLMLGQVEYRWLVSHQLGAFLLYQAGAVAPEVADFRIDDTHTSIGGGFRMGRAEAEAVRLEIGHSVEGLHATLRFRADF
jgi:hypothetical protein